MKSYSYDNDDNDDNDDDDDHDDLYDCAIIPSSSYLYYLVVRAKT